MQIWCLIHILPENAFLSSLNETGDIWVRGAAFLSRWNDHSAANYPCSAGSCWELSSSACSCCWRCPKELCPLMHTDLICRPSLTNQSSLHESIYLLSPTYHMTHTALRVAKRQSQQTVSLHKNRFRNINRWPLIHHKRIQWKWDAAQEYCDQMTSLLCLHAHRSARESGSFPTFNEVIHFLSAIDLHYMTLLNDITRGPGRPSFTEIPGWLWRPRESVLIIVKQTHPLKPELYSW